MPERLQPVDIALLDQEGDNIFGLQTGFTVGEDRFAMALDMDHQVIFREDNFSEAFACQGGVFGYSELDGSGSWWMTCQ